MTSIDLVRHEQTAATLTFGQHLGHEELSAALQLMRGFDLRGATGAIAYVTTVAQRFGLDHDVRRRLCVELYTYLKQPVQDYFAPPSQPQVEPEPSAALAPEVPVAPPKLEIPNSPLPATAQVFMALADAMNNEVMAKGGEAHRDFGLALADTLRDWKPRSKALSAWPDQSLDTDDLRARTPEELASLFHILYLALCEAIGPVQADGALHRAIAAAEQHPAAVDFPPRKLL